MMLQRNGSSNSTEQTAALSIARETRINDSEPALIRSESHQEVAMVETVEQPHPVSADEAVLSRETVEVTPSLSILGNNFDTRPFTEMEFPISAQESVTLINLKLQKIGKDEGVFFAKLKGGPESSSVLLSYYKGAIAGSIKDLSNGRIYEIKSTDIPDQIEVSRINPNFAPSCGIID